MTDTNTRPNPYVGPRPFTASDPLPGRRREVRELRSLLVAERVVLLHSPSGAGKTSLLEGQGGLKQALGEQYLIRPTIRVNQPVPANWVIPGGPAPNRYVLSVLRSLEEGAASPLPPAALVRLGLVEYLDRRKADLLGDGSRARRELLVFDQFEEILTADPGDQKLRVAFMQELSQALVERRRWVLFAIREDYLGALQPWLQALPTQLARRFRIDLLAEDGARDAIRAPAEANGVQFDADALEHLVDELLQVRVQGLDGAIEQKAGLWVEPVQLQVVCRRLWSRLAPDDLKIERVEVQNLGDMDSALAEFYAEQVAAIADRPGARTTERALREWIGTRLVSPQGVRTQVLKGEHESEGMSNAVIQALLDLHLVRAEERRGFKWFELAHDRLVGPVRRDNETWFAGHLHPMQLQAALWAQQHEPNEMLLGEEALRSAEEWAAGHGDALSATERSFLAKSRVAQQAERTIRDAQAHALALERRRVAEQLQAASRQARLAAVLAVVGVLAVVAAVVSYLQYRQTQVALVAAEEARNDASEKAREANAERERADAQAHSARSATRVATAERALFEGNVARALGLLRAVESERPLTSVPGWRDTMLKAMARRDYAVITYRGHSDSLRAVAVSADGTRIVTTSEDRTAQIWSAVTGAPIVTLAGHTDAVKSAVFSPDGASVVTASHDNTARGWDASTGALRFTLGHGDWVRTAVFSPDGASILTASWDDTAGLWDAHTGAARATLAGHTDNLVGGSFSPDGRRVITVSADNTARVWDTVTGAPIVTLGDHHGGAHAASFSPDGAHIVTVAFDATGYVWTANGRKIATFKGHTAPVLSATFSPDGRRILTASYDKTARVWDAQTGRAVATLAGHQDGVATAVFSPDGSQVLTASGDRTARIWDVETGNERHLFVGHASALVSAVYTPNAAQVVTASLDATARIWAMTPLLQVAALGPPRGTLDASALSPDGTRAVTVAADSTTAQVWDVRSGAQVVSFDEHESPPYFATFSPDGTRVISGAGMTATAPIWDAASGRRLATLNNEPADILSAQFSPDGARIVTTSNDAEPRVWDAATGAVVATLSGHTGRVKSAVFSADGLRILTGSHDKTARIWDAATGTQRAVLGGHLWALEAAVFNADATRVATVAGEPMAHVWDASGEPFATFAKGLGNVRAAAFSPDGARLAVGAMEGVVQVWDIPTRTLALTLVGQEDMLVSLAFSPDGASILTASSESSTARLWDTKTGEQLALLAGHGDGLVAAGFSRDGGRIFTRSRTGPLRIWWTPFAGDDVGAFELLWRATPLCLEADEPSVLGAAEETRACGEMIRCIHEPGASFPACLAAFRGSRA